MNQDIANSMMDSIFRTATALTGLNIAGYHIDKVVGANKGLFYADYLIDISDQIKTSIEKTLFQSVHVAVFVSNTSTGSFCSRVSLNYTNHNGAVQEEVLVGRYDFDAEGDLLASHAADGFTRLQYAKPGCVNVDIDIKGMIFNESKLMEHAKSTLNLYDGPDLADVIFPLIVYPRYPLEESGLRIIDNDIQVGLLTTTSPATQRWNIKVTANVLDAAKVIAAAKKAYLDSDSVAVDAKSLGEAVHTILCVSNRLLTPVEAGLDVLEVTWTETVLPKTLLSDNLMPV
jgi:hypothetical protein